MEDALNDVSKADCGVYEEREIASMQRVIYIRDHEISEFVKIRESTSSDNEWIPGKTKQ